MPQNNNYFSNDIGFFAIFTLLLLLSTFPACVISKKAFMLIIRYLYLQTVTSASESRFCVGK